MKGFDPKQKSKGVGDTIAKITHATGLDKVADKVAELIGETDCGCNKRRRKYNELFPYVKKDQPKNSPFINTSPLDKIEGEYLVLQDIHCTLPGIGAIVLNKETILIIDKQHPLYNDIAHYYKKNIIKKL
tara:strand:+ start:368 stop:757 length:390 start_codon:yes stop_codon:yes gene_type:complete